jgi:uncharacterized protein YecE (DUF72 family)
MRLARKRVRAEARAAKWEIAAVPCETEWIEGGKEIFLREIAGSRGEMHGFAMAIHIGCGSWADPEYTGVLYPKGLPAKARLATYAKWFDRVEVNSTYYATPRRETVANWVEQTPAKFRFDLKLLRAFSENPAAAAKGDLVARLLDAAQPLIDAKKLGAFLLTLAPSFTPARHRLDELEAVAEKLRPYPLAVELRSRGWVEGGALEETLTFFRERKLSWVALDLPKLNGPALLPAIDEVTAPRLAYMRLHGRNPDYLRAKSASDRHHYEYTGKDLREIAARIGKLESEARDVHVSVNNHAEDFAPKAALALRRLLGQTVPEDLARIVGGGDDELSLFGSE